MKRKILSISWMNDRVSAIADLGPGQSVWTAPGMVRDLQGFAEVLDLIRSQFGPGLKRVILVLDHPSLLFHVQETPPATGRMLDQVIDRAILATKFFDEPACWSRVPTAPAGTRRRQLLAIAPRSLIEGLEAVFEAADLEVAGIHPVASILSRFLGRFGLPATQPLLMVADVGGTSVLVAGRADGLLYLSRSIVDAGASQPDRLEQEINRTIFFAQQQFGVTIDRIFGVGGGGRLVGRTVREGLVVEAAPFSFDSAFLLSQAANLGRRPCFNLSLRPGKPREWVTRAIALGLAALVLLTFATTAIVEQRARAHRRQADALARQAEAATRLQLALDQRLREHRRLTALARILGPASNPPLAEWFTRYLGTIVPQQLRISRLAIGRSTNSWSIGIQGKVREPGSRFHTILEDFERTLTSGPFHARILDSTHLQTVSERSASGQRPLALPLANAPSSSDRPFQILGELP